MKLKETPKAGHRLALSMKLQKEVISDQKQPSCKKGCGLQKSQSDTRCEIKSDGQEMAVIVKFLIMTIQVNLVLNPSETWSRQCKFT